MDFELSPEEKAKLPDFPETFLPTVKEEEQKKKKKSGKETAAQPEFVGQRGHQEPK